MKHNNHISNSFTSVIMILMVTALNYQSVYAQKNSDSYTFSRDLNHLLLNTELEKEIVVNKSRSRNVTKSKIKKNVDIAKTAKKQEKQNLISISYIKTNSVTDNQSEITPSNKYKSGAFKIVLNELNINYLNTSHRINKIFSSKTQVNNPTVLTQSKPNTTTHKNSKSQLAKTSNEKTNYWNTLHFIESSSGKRLYRKRNKARSCKWTTTPCGHHQLSVQALKDIGCKSLKCRSARENYNKSLSMSIKLEQINSKRMKKKGYNSLPDYQRYLVHQQGATGLGRIMGASKGKKNLSKKTLKYMANNSPYSYKHLKRAGSRGAARKFLNHWEEKWKVNNSARVASR